MANKMLIDSSHPEETRVVVTRGNRIEEFDFESHDKKQLKGNIYLARVTRVEPSLQAAFVEYGGNRHGFLAFSEIHPDYYQIPIADRQALLRDEEEAARQDDEDEDDRNGKNNRDRRRRGKKSDKLAKAKASDIDSSDDGETDEGSVASLAANADAFIVSEDIVGSDQADDETPVQFGEAGHDGENASSSDDLDDNSVPSITQDDDEDSDDSDIENVGAEDAMEEAQPRRRASRRNYKIQEVIKRRQILLVQVVKEERGNKGAALTTYLSLAGRYSVLMPNTARGGGISRKITNVADRSRLKAVVKDLDVPEGMGVILRTAGANRTKPEIKRDYEYLMRMWEQVRNLTLKSTAPSLVYEEGSLIKRSVRDLYNKDIDEILVAGDEGYREAKDFMRMLMPSHAKAVQPYRDPTPLYARYGVESQLDRMLQPQVTLKSGGYLIINQTEALVAIDVNSGRSTREHSIEDTALQTNLEATEEVARQLRLRDMAGLIVIDFIDMEEKRNNRAVEKKLKDCLRNDRARIQVGRISPFGLLEMSRQRIRASVLDSTMESCPHCGGTGHVRSEPSLALYVLRAIEEYLTKDARNDIIVRTTTKTALYVLNNKRANLIELETRFGLVITLQADDHVGTKLVEIDRGNVSQGTPAIQSPVPDLSEENAIDDALAAEAEASETAQADSGEDDDNGRRKKRRRRRRRGGRDRDNDNQQAGSQSDESDNSSEDVDGTSTNEADQDDDSGDEDKERKKRRRGKRGGRRNRRPDDDQNSTEDDDVAAGSADATSSDDTTGNEDLTSPSPADVDAKAAAAIEGATVTEAASEAEATEKPKKRTRRKKTDAAKDDAAEDTTEAKTPRKRTRRKKVEAETASNEDASVETNSAKAEDVAASSSVETADNVSSENSGACEKANEVLPATSGEPIVTSDMASEDEVKKPRKGGWWQRKGFF